MQVNKMVTSNYKICCRHSDAKWTFRVDLNDTTSLQFEDEKGNSKQFKTLRDLFIYIRTPFCEKEHKLNRWYVHKQETKGIHDKIFDRHYGVNWGGVIIWMEQDGHMEYIDTKIEGESFKWFGLSRLYEIIAEWKTTQEKQAKLYQQKQFIDPKLCNWDSGAILADFKKQFKRNTKYH